MKLKTSELEGAALDWSVAVCEFGITTVGILDKSKVMVGAMLYKPSTNWAQGGPLIECYEVALSPEQFGWEASVYDGGHMNPVDGSGSTPLIAACRAIVAAHLGGEVDVPEELV